MEKILYTAFNGKNNSSKILLDNISCSKKDKLYLKNSFETSVAQLKKKLQNNNYDLIISFGQCPLPLNTIKIEKNGKNHSEILTTNCKLFAFKKKLEENDFEVIISEDAGSYLCNNIYYNGLKIIEETNLDCMMIFIHIPKLESIDIEKLSKIFN